jgi:hypothetical protein
MLPPVSTHHLQTAIETKRREEAALRWIQLFPVGRAPSPSGPRDVAIRRPKRV